MLPYKKGPRIYDIYTPERKLLVRRLVRKSYISMAAGAVDSSDMGPPIVSRICTNIKTEMKAISTITHNSFLRNSVESVKQFSWETVHEELLNQMPTLMAILSSLIPKSAKRKPLQCTIASQLLKCRHPEMALVQRAVSVMMYGNSVPKQVLFYRYAPVVYICCVSFQVYANLQPLNICLTHQGTANIIKKISQDYDAEVREWAKKLESIMEKPSQPVRKKLHITSRLYFIIVLYNSHEFSC